MIVPCSDPLAQVQKAVVSLFDNDVAVAVTDPQLPQPALMASEQIAMSAAVPVRQKEFAAGRAAARQAMSDLGLQHCAIPSGTDRAPVWPKGVVGSISHTRRFCCAVVAPAGDLRSLGIDIESAAPLEPDLIPMICSEAERTRMAGINQALWAKLIFSAKEAAYKAQYPLSKLLFGFDHMDVTLDETDGSFVATFLKLATPFTVGDRLPGRFERVADHLVTGVAIGQDTRKGA